MITFDNFYIATKAIFKGCKKPLREPDYISYYTYGYDQYAGKALKRVSSSYWYGENSKGKYIIRESDHWVNMKPLNNNSQIKDCNSIASCNWNYKGKEAFIKTKNLKSAHHPHWGYEYNIKNKKNICGKAYLKDFTAN